jgi:hypothetical protein
VLAIDVGM